MGKEKIIFILILFLALGLRLWGANQSFWLDEASQAGLSSLSVSQIWQERQGDFHPPLFYLLAHYWLMFGKSEVWLRLLPITFGILGVAAMYLLGSEIMPATKIKIGSIKLHFGEITAFLLAINPFHIYYSQEFRMYSLLAYLGIVAMYLFIKSNRFLWISLALMLYTHYASLLLLPTLLLYSWFFEPKKIRYVLIQWGLAAVAFTPWVPQFLIQLRSGVNIDTYLPGWRGILALGPVRSVPLVIFKLVAGRIDFVSRPFYAVYAASVLLLVGASLFMTKVKRWFIVSWLFIPLVAAILISFVIPLTQPFRLIFMLPALILVLGQAVVRFPRLMLLLIMYISVTGVVMYTTRPRLQREQWREAAAYLQSAVSADSAVVVKFSGNFAPLEWYAPNLEVVAAVPTYPAKLEEVSKSLAPIQSFQRVYVLSYLGELTDPYDTVDKHLQESGFTDQEITNFEGVGFIHHYSRQL